MPDFLVTFTDLKRSFLIENARNEADATNRAFERAGLNDGKNFYHVIVEQTPIMQLKVKLK